ncbi:hypothetical protein [Achromobacter animicus]|uniref:hypothetical protein n=1 Tax=Achromobacter animicus TaxID=1389935 RepID=UPI0028B2330E|nr:hypothetical protein [Achromobacter animicus]
MTTALFTTRRCQVGDLVMLVRSKNAARLGRIGVVVCSTTSAAAAELVLPNELAEVQRRDWIVDFQGAPDVTCRDGEVIVTNLLACRDATLRPLRTDQAEMECEAALALGGEA